MRPLSRLTSIGAMALMLSAKLLAQDALRADVGRPLQAAQGLIRSGHYREALTQVQAADKISGKTAYETQTIERMRLAAASGAGDLRQATQAYQALDTGGHLPAAEKVRDLESLAGVAYRTKDWAQTRLWVERYVEAGGADPAISGLSVQTNYLSGDYGAVIRTVRNEVQQSQRAHRAPAKDRLTLLLTAASRSNDEDTYIYAVEQLLTYYPNKQYWGDLLARLQNKPGFGDRYALVTYRLALATDSLSRAEDYLDYAELAAQAGYPQEGRQVLSKGLAAGVLGTGSEAARHKRLLDLLAKRSEQDRADWSQVEQQARAAHDGPTLIKLGYKLAQAGQRDKGLELMTQGVHDSGTSQAALSQLNLGVAQALSDRPAQASATLRGVAGSDQAAELARLWSIYVRGKSTAA